MQVVTLMTLKLAFLFFYRRIFRGRTFNIASWTLIGIVVAWAISFFVAILAACGTSVRANFETLGTLKAKCVDTFIILVCLAVFDVVVDLAIMILPIPLVMWTQWNCNLKQLTTKHPGLGFANADKAKDSSDEYVLRRCIVSRPFL